MRQGSSAIEVKALLKPPTAEPVRQCAAGDCGTAVLILDRTPVGTGRRVELGLASRVTGADMNTASSPACGGDLACRRR